MNKRDEKIIKIREKKSHEELLEMWAKILDREPIGGWPPGKALEYVILRAFEIEGAKVTYPFQVRFSYPLSDEGVKNYLVEEIDGAIFDNFFHCIAEIKDYKEDSKIALDPLASLRFKLSRRPSGVVGLFFSASDFTEPARLLASIMQPQTILLWNRDDIQYSLEQKAMREGLARKYRHYVEHVVPDLRLQFKEIEE
jgi:hypothetical protein